MEKRNVKILETKGGGKNPEKIFFLLCFTHEKFLEEKLIATFSLMEKKCRP